VLSSNPIGASGLIRFAEAAIQVMGKAGDHQVPDARTALGTPTAAGRNTTRCGWSGPRNQRPNHDSADSEVSYPTHRVGVAEFTFGAKVF
jgi:acetyl-CoA C-acetyltransferase